MLRGNPSGYERAWLSRLALIPIPILAAFLVAALKAC